MNQDLKFPLSSPCSTPNPNPIQEGSQGDQSPRPGVARGGKSLEGMLTSSVQGCPLAFALLDECRGAVGRKHLHTLSRASLGGQEERGPALVVPYIQIHQRLSQCLQGFTVTVVGLGGRGRQPPGTARDTAPTLLLGPMGKLQVAVLPTSFSGLSGSQPAPCPPSPDHGLLATCPQEGRSQDRVPSARACTWAWGR